MTNRSDPEGGAGVTDEERTEIRAIARNAGIDLIVDITRRFVAGEIALEDGLDELWQVLEMMPRIASAEDRAAAYQRIRAALDEDQEVTA